MITYPALKQGKVYYITSTSFEPCLQGSEPTAESLESRSAIFYSRKDRIEEPHEHVTKIRINKLRKGGLKLPGNAPVWFNLQDSGIFSVVKPDLGISKLCIINVYQNRCAPRCYTSRGDTYYFMGVPPTWTQESNGRRKSITQQWISQRLSVIISLYISIYKRFYR